MRLGDAGLETKVETPGHGGRERRSLGVSLTPEHAREKLAPNELDAQRHSVRSSTVGRDNVCIGDAIKPRG